MVVAATGAFVVGFLIGLFTFRIKSRWCPECGATTTSTESRHGQSTTARGRVATQPTARPARRPRTRHDRTTDSRRPPICCERLSELLPLPVSRKSRARAKQCPLGQDRVRHPV
jgi:hypothetical protein